MACAACGPFVDPASVQNRADVAAGLLGGNVSIGEQFTPSCNGLSAIEVQVAGYPDVTTRNGNLSLILDRRTPELAVRVANQNFEEASLSGNDWIRLDFAPIPDSRDHAFVLTAKASGDAPAPFTLWASSHIEAPGTQRYKNNVPQPGALTMRVSCETTPWEIATRTLAAVDRNRWLWTVALALCVIPGLGVAVWTAPRDRDVAALLGYAAGWSVLLAPLALTVVSPLGLGSIAGPVLLAGGSIAVVARFRARISRSGPTSEIIPATHAAPFDYDRAEALQITGPALIALVGTLGAVVVRTAIARDLVLPLWVDSVQHSYIVQLILDAGRVPSTYGAAMPTEPFDYHFAFHALAAFGAWTAGSSAAQSVLATGQILGFLIPLAVYALARDLTGSTRPAALAALLVSVVTTQPTYFVTWGRYPELAGLIALPAGFVALRAATAKNTPIAAILAAIVAGAAMPLVHPRVSIFLAALFVGFLVASSRFGTREFARMGLRTIAIAMASGLLVSPWILRQWSAHHDRLSLPIAFGPIDFPFGFATAGNDRWVLGVALIGLGIAAIDRVDLLVTMSVWAALVLVAANPNTFGLPVYLWVNNDSVAIALFVPATILAGYAVVRLADVARYPRWPALLRTATGIGVVVLAFTQLPSLLAVVNPCCYLAGNADLRAMVWIEAHTPSTARFLVNEYRWSGTVWAGSDAGFWLPVLAHRESTMPAMFYALGPHDAVQIVDDTAAAIEANGTKPGRLAAVARGVDARYVYVGTRGGPIDPYALADDPNFQVVYRDGGAWVFEVVGGGDASTTTTG